MSGSGIPEMTWVRAGGPTSRAQVYLPWERWRQDRPWGRPAWRPLRPRQTSPAQEQGTLFKGTVAGDFPFLFPDWIAPGLGYSHFVTELPKNFVTSLGQHFKLLHACYSHQRFVKKTTHWSSKIHEKDYTLVIRDSCKRLRLNISCHSHFKEERRRRWE